jgi:hypothetical protein
MKVPTLTPVESSNIQKIGYGDNRLFVQFQGGKTYSYPGAPKKLHDDMLKSDSVGRFFQGPYPRQVQHELARLDGQSHAGRCNE